MSAPPTKRNPIRSPARVGAMRAGRDGKRPRTALAVVVAVLLTAGAGAAYLRQEPTTVSVDAAVEAFRSPKNANAATQADAPPTSSAAPVASEPAGPATATASAPADAAAPTPNDGGPSNGRPGTSTPPSRAASGSSSESAPAAPAAQTPQSADVEEGVYTYATEGYEETNALGGARHDYPKETAMTLRRSGCGGWTQRWQPLRERWDESELCAEQNGAAFAVRRFTTYHEFFQRGQQQEFTCPEGSHVSRRQAAAGATWTWRCTAGSSAIDTNVTVVGTEPLTIGGTTMDAVHMHYESTMTGANRGTQDQHRWLHADTGLNLKIQTDIDTEADSPFGAVAYVERYTITLTSLTPRR